MPQRLSLVNNGLVNSRDPSMNAEGELILADDAFYKPNSPSIFKISGRVAYNTSAETAPIRDGRYLEFDNDKNLIVALRGSDILKDTAALTGTLSALTLPETWNTEPPTIDSFHFNNEYYLFMGTERNLKIDEDEVVTFHSMLASVEPPTFTLDSILTGYTLSNGVKMLYWVEERVKNAAGSIIKRSEALAVDVLTVTGNGTLLTIRILRPTIVNSDATHWAAISSSADGTFPVGAEVGEAAVAVNFVDDARTGTDPGLPGGELYELVSVSLTGITTVVPRNGAAPKATTGDVFEETLMTNDVDNPSHLRFSFPTVPDAWPATNVIKFNDKERDVVRVIVRMGQFALVALRGGLYRIDTLPQANDSVFATERVKAKIDGAFGCVNAKAGVLFSFGDGLRFAYVSRYGILITDGSRWDVLTDDIDWEALVEVSKLDLARLINNPRLYRLELTYVPKGGLLPTKMLLLHYHPSHAKTGGGGGLRAKVTGPINRDANGLWVTQISEVAHVFSGNDDGRVYVHDQGNIEPTAQGGIKFEIKTGDQYANNVGGEIVVRRAYTHHAAAPGQKAESTVTFLRDGQTPLEQSRDIPLDVREASVHYRSGRCVAYQLGVRNSDSLGEIAINFLGVDWTPWGPAEEKAK